MQLVSLNTALKNTAGANTNISLKGIRSSLAEAEINTAMDAIIANNAFYSTGGDLVSKVKADIVDTNTSSFQLS